MAKLVIKSYEDFIKDYTNHPLTYYDKAFPKVVQYFKENNMENLMDYGNDSDEGLYHLSSMYQEIMDNLDKIIQSILFVAGDGVEYFDIADKLGVTVEEVESAIEKLKIELEDSKSGIQIITFNKKAQLCSNPDYADQVAEVLNPIKEKALTKAVMETAAIIAYKQPITRLEIEQVRGVNSDYAINNLLENKLIEVVGRKDAIGKPLVFGTTDEFLKRFSLNALADLPDYDELLDRIKVIKGPQNSALFDYSNINEDEETNKEEMVEEQNVEADKNDVVNELLSALSEDDETQNQA